MYFFADLAEALAPHPKAPSAPPPASVKPAKSPAAKAVADQLNLNLVMDVELNVTLRFGQRQLTLREVLDLTTGSVVELDRQVEEPVELLLDGVVIARGEAVVVDGNYGLRVTEVLQHVSATMIK
jgi:flagellar motor switch protein FliN/FliY